MKKDEIEIVWGTLSYRGSLANLKPAIETVFKKLPPTIAAFTTEQQLSLSEEAIEIRGYE